ncbi:fibronectin-binding protein [Mycolicibacterium hodleri]|uniref:Fibronectin-binding protein n=1 Tax=Mycolicibacterium hodleri TaxID=49897 RepID=A0A502EIU7_9MYCO|nr:fibronectin-binding protein [Mycolicibacterium hodleri]TPG36420.1 fibronectin-binding protein [Mycolicibacterium hodleri]
MVITKKRAVIVAVGVLGATLGAAAPAGADPSDDQCPLSVTILCRFLPIAPGLDHDIDLTQGPGSLNGQALPEMPHSGQSPEDVPPAQICPTGCG